MVKEAVEDYKRHRQDVEVNNRAVEVSTCLRVQRQPTKQQLLSLACAAVLAVCCSSRLVQL